MTRRRLRLVHWNAGEARETAATLRAAGYVVNHAPVTPETLRELRRNPPDAVVIDLTRIPSQGRDVALGIRGSKTTRHIPIVFVEGDSKKVVGVKRLLPDAEYTTWRRIRSSLKRAIANPPAEPSVPASNLAGYSGTPLVKKLGIKAGYKVSLVGSPADFEKTLGALPDGVTLLRRLSAADLIIWFTKSRAELERRIGALATKVGDGGMWIAWPKQASGVATDVTQNDVRRIGLGNGLVDYKICAIDATWSGLKFARRKGERR
jgi:CheY-like chemotaxis protein